MKYNLILADGREWETLRPLTLTRSVASLRMGILTFRERWERLLQTKSQIQTQAYIQPLYGEVVYDHENLFINPAFLPNLELLAQIIKLEAGESLQKSGETLAAVCSPDEWSRRRFRTTKAFEPSCVHVQRCWDLFTHNADALNFDYALITLNRKSQPLSPTNGVLGSRIFVEEGAQVEFATLNSETGPIYIGKNTEIMEGSLIRGGLALCENAKLNLGTKIYGATTIGPYCKVGGEVNNSILTGFSNKGHEGFLGNSVLGEWCNLGADTNNSNLKNNYSRVRMWDYATENDIDSGLLFCGLMMGDHSKAAINSQFNTGTTVGVGANIFVSGFPPKFIPNFSWGGEKESPRFDFEKFCVAAQAAMQRRNRDFEEKEKKLFSFLFDNP